MHHSQSANKNRGINLIIFDLYGVICSGSYKNISQNIVKKYHLPFTKVYDVVYHQYFSAAALGKISEADAFRFAVKELGIAEDWRKLRRKHYRYVTVVNRLNLKYAMDLRKRGYTIVLLSKNTPPQFEYTVRKLKLRRKFGHVINTYALGLSKAAPQTIKLMLKQFKVKPQETVMIDDQSFNLVSPKQFGAHVILYKNPTQLRRAVEAFVKVRG
jgi:putative hydrolase of the HAD superfamily